MNISCDVIKDILPLYAENMVSSATRELVDDHLCDCDQCTAVLAKLVKQPELVPEANTESLKRVRKTIQRNRLLAVLICFFLTSAVALGAFALLTRPIYLTPEEAQVQLVEENNMVYFEFGDNVDCFCISYEHDESGLDVVITAYRRIWNVHYGNMNDYRYDREISERRWGVTNNGSLRRISYGNSETGQEDKLLWGEEPQEHSISLPRLVLNYYVLIALAAGIVFAVCGLLAHRKKIGKYLTAFALFFFSYVAGSYTVIGRNLLVHVSSDLPWYLGMISCCTILIWGALLCTWGLIGMRSQSK